VEYSLDDADRGILTALQRDSKATNAEIAQQVGLSAAAVHARVKRLQDDGVIDHYTAIVNRERIGFDMLCFVQVSLRAHDRETTRCFSEAIKEMPQVLECYQLIGDIDYLLKVVFRSKDDLRRFLMEGLTSIEGVTHIKTSLALTEVKSTTILPLDGGE